MLNFPAEQGLNWAEKTAELATPAALLRAKGRVVAATYRTKLIMSTARLAMGWETGPHALT